MHCINTSHADYKNLVKDSGLPSEVVAAFITNWQLENKNLERFPELRELFNKSGDTFYDQIQSMMGQIDEKIVMSDLGINENTSLQDFINSDKKLDKMYKDVLKANPGVILEFSNTLPNQFDEIKNVVSINLKECRAISGITELSLKEVVKSFIQHELTHSATFYAAKENEKFKKELTILLNAFIKSDSIKPYFDKLRAGVRDLGTYQYNLQEFIADINSNKSFINYVKGVSPKGEAISWYNKIVDEILRLLNSVFNTKFKVNSVYDAVQSIITSDQFIEDNAIISEAGEDNISLQSQSLKPSSYVKSEQTEETLNKDLSEQPFISVVDGETIIVGNTEEAIKENKKNFDIYNENKSKEMGVYPKLPFMSFVDKVKGWVIKVNKSLLKLDFINEDFSFDEKLKKERLQTLKEHFKTIFPGIGVETISRKKLESLFPTKTKEELNSILAFYSSDDKKVFIANDKALTLDVLIEEFLHPFVNSLSSNNETKTIFKSLLEEAKQMASVNGSEAQVLYNQIKTDYTVAYNGNMANIEKEFLTQMLAKEFNKVFLESEKAEKLTIWQKLVRNLMGKIRDMLYALGVKPDITSLEEIGKVDMYKLVQYLQKEKIRLDVFANMSEGEKIWFNINKNISDNLNQKGFEIVVKEYKKVIDTLKAIRGKIYGEEALSKANASLAVQLNKLDDKEIINLEQITNELINLFAGFNITSSSIKKGIDEAITLNPQELAGVLFKAEEASQKIATAIQDFKNLIEIDKISSADATLNPLLASMTNVEADIDYIHRTYMQKSVMPVVEKLYPVLELSTKRFIEEQEKDIKNWEKEQQNLDKNSRPYKILQKNIDTAKKLIIEKAATKENLKLELQSTNTKSGDVNWWNKFFVAAVKSGQMTVTSIFQFTVNILQRGETEALSKIADINDLKEEFYRENPDESKEAFERTFKPLTESKVVFRRGQDGELIKDEAWPVFLHELDVIGYNNKLKELDDLITDPNLTEQQRKDAKEVKAEFIKDYGEDYYTKEYNEIMSFLLPEARQARQVIIDEMSRLKAEKYVASPSEFPLLQQLYAIEQTKFEALDSIYDEYGNKKKGVDLMIAENIKQWKELKKDTSVPIISKLDKDKWEAQKRDIDEDFKNGLISEEQKNAWYDENVKKTFSQEYYNKSSHLWNIIFKILSKLNYTEEQQAKDEQELNDLIEENKNNKDNFLLENDLNQEISNLKEIIELRKENREVGEEIKNLRTKVNDLTKRFKDKNGDIRVQDIPLNIILQLKSIQEELIELKTKSIKVSGLSEEEFKDLVSARRKLRFPNISEEEKNHYRQVLNSLKQKQDVSALDQDDVKKLGTAYEELEELSIKEKTIHYTKAYEDEFTKFKLQPEIMDQNLSESELNKAFEKSEWFQNNHIYTTIWIKEMDDLGYIVNKKIKGYIPLSSWERYVPVDEDYIIEESPSNSWTSWEVKPEFINPNYKFIDGSFMPRKLDFTSSNPNNPKDDAYQNKKWRDLTDKQKSFLSKYTNLFFKIQENIAEKNQRLGLKLPGIVKSSYDDGLLRSIPNKLSLLLFSIKNITYFKNQPKGVDQASDFNTDKRTDRIYLKYRGRLDENKISYNLFDSLGIFTREAIIYSALNKEMQTVMSAKALLKNVAGTTKKYEQIENEINKLVFNAYDSRDPGFFVKTLSTLQRLGGEVILAINPISDIKNVSSAFFMSKAYADNKFFTIKEYELQFLKLSNKIFEASFHDPLNISDKTEIGQIFDYFKVIQGDLRSEIGKGFMNRISKGLFSREVMFKGREIGEMLVQGSLAFSMSKSPVFKVMLNGNLVPLFEAYEKGTRGVLVRKKGAFTDKNGVTWDEERIRQFEEDFISVLGDFNLSISGNFKKYNKAEYQRGWSNVLLGFFQRHFWSGLDDRFSGRKVNYIVGKELNSTYRALGKLIIDITAQNAIFAKDVVMSKIQGTETPKYVSAFKTTKPSDLIRAQTAYLENFYYLQLSIFSFLLRLMLKNKDNGIENKVFGWTILDATGSEELTKTEFIDWTLLNIIDGTSNELANFNVADFIHDYNPRITNKSTGETYFRPKQMLQKFADRNLTKKILFNFYYVNKVILPIVQDAWGLYNDDPTQSYQNTYGTHQKGDLKLAIDVLNAVPGGKTIGLPWLKAPVKYDGQGDIIYNEGGTLGGTLFNPKEYNESLNYFRN